MEKFKQQLATQWQAFVTFVSREEHRHKARALAQELNDAFTAHPRSAGESYGEHLWFTTSMAARFLVTMVVIFLHGLFPFLLERTASRMIEDMYRIMKARIPPARRDEIDSDYSV